MARAGVADGNPERAVDDRDACGRPPTSSSPAIRAVSGSIRVSAPRNSLLTHTASRPIAISDGPSAAPRATVAVTTLRAGSMRETVPSGVLTTHTPSAAAATPAAPRRSGIVRTAVAARALISVTVPAGAGHPDRVGGAGDARRLARQPDDGGAASRSRH